jgi:hypothetical protein
MAPVALTSAGEIVMNAAEFQNDTSPLGLLRYAENSGLVVFVGVVVPADHVKTIMRDVDDAAADITGRCGPMLVRRRKAR